MKNVMSESSYKELQEQGVFDVPYRAFEFMQSQQAKIDAITKQRDSFIKAHHIAMNDVCEHKAKIDGLQARIDKVICRLDNGICHVGSEALFNILKGNKDEN